MSWTVYGSACGRISPTVYTRFEHSTCLGSKYTSMDDSSAHHMDWFIAVGYSATGEQVGFRSFTGDGAKEDAKQHFEALKARPDCVEAWWAKLMNRQWEFYGMEKRSTQGEWVPTHFRD
jgi:hypothetical protein